MLLCFKKYLSIYQYIWTWLEPGNLWREKNVSNDLRDRLSCAVKQLFSAKCFQHQFLILNINVPYQKYSCLPSHSVFRTSSFSVSVQQTAHRLNKYSHFTCNASEDCYTYISFIFFIATHLHCLYKLCYRFKTLYSCYMLQSAKVKLPVSRLIQPLTS